MRGQDRHRGVAAWRASVPLDFYVFARCARHGGRVRGLETVLTEKGYVDPKALDFIIDAFETKIGPHIGARVVAKAWIDPDFKRRLIADATTAVGELGLATRAPHLIAVENTPRLHNLVVCSLCSGC